VNRPWQRVDKKKGCERCATFTRIR